MRYNKIIDLLEHGKPVFSTSTVSNGSLDDLTYIADSDYDAVIIEMEHEGFSFTTLRTSLQVLLNRKRIAEKGQPATLRGADGADSSERPRAQPVGDQAGAGHRRVWSGIAPPEHSGGRPSRCRGGTVSPGAGGARLCTGGRARLGQSHCLPILGPDPAGILRRRRPLASGP